MLSLAYINFWNQNYDMIQDFWLLEFVKENICQETKLVNYSDNPDILIASCFGNIEIIQNIKAKVKIFFYGENLEFYPQYNNHSVLKNTFDLIVGFKNTNLKEKLIRLPLWLTYYSFYSYKENNNILDYIEESYKKNIQNLNKKNASLISRHDKNGLRSKIYNEISKYTEVLCPGNFKNNTKKIGGSNNDKINFIKNTIYNICPENSKFEGYHTEKIFHALEAGCIPIYWGIDKPEANIINKDCYCWVDYDSKDFAENIKDVIVNKEKYIKENIFTFEAKYIVDNFYKTLKEQIENKLNLSPKPKTYGISYTSRHYANRYIPITEQGTKCGLFYNFKCWREEDVDEEFKNKYSEIWNDSTRGGGWWIWKPYIITKQLEKLTENDILVYIDGGCSINITNDSFKRFIEYVSMVKNDWSGLLRFELTHKEFKFTNKHTINFFQQKFNIDNTTMQKYISSNQILATIIILRKTKFSMDFFNKTLEIIDNDPFLLTDKYNVNETHRHDQSVMSLLYKTMHGSLILNDETYFDEGFNTEKASKYPFWATRRRN